jgi:hypothetical protein
MACQSLYRPVAFVVPRAVRLMKGWLVAVYLRRSRRGAEFLMSVLNEKAGSRWLPCWTRGARSIGACARSAITSIAHHVTAAARCLFAACQQPVAVGP